MSEISTISKKLIFEDPFYGHFALGLKKEFEDGVGTACVGLEGLDTVMYFEKQYWDKLNERQRIGLMQHELMHIIFFDLIYCKEYENKALFNIAADLRINQYISAEMLPTGALTLNHFKEIDLPPFEDARTYYNLLDKNQDKCQNLQNLLNYLNGGGTAVCSHKKWNGDQHQEDVEKFGELAKKQVEHIVKEVYESHLKRQAGNLPKYLRDFITDAYKKTEPTIDWKSIIRSFGTSCSNTFIKKSRNKPNDRFPDNAAVKIKPKKKLLVALDTSGSIGNTEFNLFIDQIEHIKKSGAEVHVVECDAAIGRHYDYTSREKIGQFTGGGGTCFSPVIEFFKKEKYNGLIYLTDGYCCDSQNTILNKPVLWVIIPGGTENFKFNGTKISMKK